MRLKPNVTATYQPSAKAGGNKNNTLLELMHFIAVHFSERIKEIQ